MSFWLSLSLSLLMSTDRTRLRQDILDHMEGSEHPLLFFPEGWDCNGTALMQFNRYLFGVGMPVLPVAMNVYIPLLPVHPGVLGTKLWVEILLLSFYPCIVWYVKRDIVLCDVI
jgi:hypothetical protein